MKRLFLAARAMPAVGAADASITITTAAVDHYGDRVLPEGADLSDYNGAVLWNHDAAGYTESAGIPIGVATSIVPERNGLRGSWRWLRGDAFSDRVRNAFDQRVINAASIGFLPIDYKPNDVGGYDHSRWKLMEVSLTAIGANPEAVRFLKALGLEPRRLPLFSDVERRAWIDDFARQIERASARRRA